MSQPIFVIGPQRSGTSILARTICRAEGVAGRHFNPCPRWDIPAMAELGALTGRTPLLAAMDEWIVDRSEPSSVVRFALPWAAESFAWPRLAKRWASARIVFIRRGVQDTFASWRTLNYLADAAKAMPLESYKHWHDAIAQLAHACPDACCIEYESLVLGKPACLTRLWKWLDLTPPSLPDDWFHKPRHWSGGDE